MSFGLLAFGSCLVLSHKASFDNSACALGNRAVKTSGQVFGRGREASEISPLIKLAQVFPVVVVTMMPCLVSMMCVCPPVCVLPNWKWRHIASSRSTFKIMTGVLSLFVCGHSQLVSFFHGCDTFFDLLLNASPHTVSRNCRARGGISWRFMDRRRDTCCGSEDPYVATRQNTPVSRIWRGSAPT